MGGGFEDLAFLIPAFLSTACTVLVGGAFLFIAWLRALSAEIEPAADSETAIETRRAFISLWALTLSVVLDLAVFPVQLLVNQTDTFRHGMPLYQVVWSCFLIPSFALQLLSIFTAHLEPIRTKKIVRIGAILVVIGNLICLAIYMATSR